MARLELPWLATFSLTLLAVACQEPKERRIYAARPKDTVNICHNYSVTRSGTRVSICNYCYEIDRKALNAAEVMCKDDGGCKIAEASDERTRYFEYEMVHSYGEPRLLPPSCYPRDGG